MKGVNIMKKKALAIVGIVIVLVFTILCFWMIKKPNKIKFPNDSDIKLIQYNGFIVQGNPTKVSEYEKVWKKNIENAKPLSKFHNITIKPDSSCYVFSIVEKNENIITFNLFKKDKKCYLKTEDGALYTDIEAIDKLVDIEKSSKIYNLKNKSILSDEFYDDLLKYDKKIDFIKYCKKNKFSNQEMYQSSYISFLCNGEKKSDINSKATKTVVDINAEYENGKKNKVTTDKSEYEKFIKTEIQEFKNNSRYKKIDKVFKKAGYNFKDYLLNSKRVFMNYQIEYMNFKYQQEFLNGNLKVNGRYAENINDYSSSRLTELINKGLSKKAQKKIESDCEDAYKKLQ
ncbi:hypothetical protein [Lachnobacterium bovis]|uniref:hypothetical protein n=1 Tax=Lachnobacterium bovis TaxID=140626 RepID=UPI000482D25A|nr:hypothetical protein [Lachnobacterium bovis]